MRTKLKERRLEQGYTQQALADKININRATYANVESGKKNPSLALAIKIKKALSYENDDIFFVK